MPAGDRYVEVTLDDMERFLKRAFRALKPKRGESRGEVYYDLNLSDGEVLIRVWTSIRPHSQAGAGVGEDAIRVTMITKGGKPLMPKGKIVMRTKNWKNALQDRIEDLHEVYEDKAEYWKNRRRDRDGEASGGDDAEAEVHRLEQENAEGPITGPRSGPKKTAPPASFEGGYRNLGGDQWGVQIWQEGQPGQEGIAATKGNKRTKVRLVERVKAFKDPYKANAYSEIWKFEDVNAKPRQQGGGRWAEDSMVDSLVSRYLAG
jgi:hypothetical protein